MRWMIFLLLMTTAWGRDCFQVVFLEDFFCIAPLDCQQFIAIDGCESFEDPFIRNQVRAFFLPHQRWHRCVNTPFYALEEVLEDRDCRFHKLKPKHPVFFPEINMSVTPFLLEHPLGFATTAFIVEVDKNCILFCGKTLLDEKMRKLWKKAAHLLREKRLRALIIECTFPEDFPEDGYFDCFDHKRLIEELHLLRHEVDRHNLHCLKGLKVIIKCSLTKRVWFRHLIKKELESINDLGIEFFFTEPGQRWIF